MKRIFSVLTISLLASSTIADASKFNINEAVKEENPIRASHLFCDQLFKLAVKERTMTKSKAALKEEKEALQSVFEAKLGKELAKKAAATIGLNSAHRHYYRGHDDNPLVTNTRLMEMHQASMENEDVFGKMGSQADLSFYSSLKGGIQTDSKLLVENVTKYDQAVKKRKALSPKFDPKKASLEEFRERWSYLVSKEAGNDNGERIFSEFYKLATTTDDLNILRHSYKIALEQKLERKKRYQDFDGEEDQSKSFPLVIKDGLVLNKDKKCEQNPKIKGTVGDISIALDNQNISYNGSSISEDEKPVKHAILFYKNVEVGRGEVSQESESYNKNRFHGYCNFNRSADQTVLPKIGHLDPNDFRVVGVDEDGKYNYLDIPQEAVRFRKDEFYWEQALTLKGSEVYEGGKALTKEPLVKGEFHPSYLGNKVLNLQTWGGPGYEGSSHYAVFYKDFMVADFRRGWQKREENEKFYDLTVPEHQRLKIDVYLFNLDSDSEFNPELLKVVAFDYQDLYGFLPLSKLTLENIAKEKAAKEAALKKAATKTPSAVKDAPKVEAKAPPKPTVKNETEKSTPVKSALSLRNGKDVYEHDQPLKKSDSLTGEFIPTLSAKKVLNVVGWCQMNMEPAKEITVFYGDKAIGSLTTTTPSAIKFFNEEMPNYMRFSGDLDLSHLKEEFNSKLLKVVGIGHQNQFNFLALPKVEIDRLAKVETEKLAKAAAEKKAAELKAIQVAAQKAAQKAVSPVPNTTSTKELSTPVVAKIAPVKVVATVTPPAKAVVATVTPPAKAVVATVTPPAKAAVATVTPPAKAAVATVTPPAKAAVVTVTPPAKTAAPAVPAKTAVPAVPAKTATPAVPAKTAAPAVPAKTAAPVVPAKTAAPAALAKAPPAKAVVTQPKTPGKINK